MLLWGVALLVQLAAVLERGGRVDPWELARELRASGSSIKALLPLARRLQTSQLRAIVEHVVDLDTALKTGEIRGSLDAAEEQLAIIDRTLLLLSSAR
jgi:DNA polymerase III delta subunit